MSEHMEKEALLFLSLPLPDSVHPNDNAVIEAKINVFLANRKCRNCYHLLRSLQGKHEWEIYFRIFVREAIQANMEKDVLTLPLNTREKQIFHKELEVSRLTQNKHITTTRNKINKDELYYIYNIRLFF